MRAIIRRICFDGLLYLTNRIVARFPSHSLRLFFYRRVMGFQIGRRSFIFMDAWFDTKGGLTMGDHSVVNQKCRLDTRGTVTIGDNVSISSEVCILTADHDPASPYFAGRHRPVRIADFAFIGTRATILPGVTVGKGAVVGAGAVVTKDVSPFKIVAGCPARTIGSRNPDLHYKTDYGRLFW
jgi:acetyltransferase-like isoleucine patch superfamily enzyme